MLARSGTMIRKKGRGGSVRKPSTRSTAAARRDSNLSRGSSTRSSRSDSALIPSTSGGQPPRGHRSSSDSGSSVPHGSHDSGVYLVPPAEGESAALKQSLGKTYSSPGKLTLTQLVSREDVERGLSSGGWSRDLSLDQPNYGSVALQLNEASRESQSSFEFVKKSGEILHGTTLVTVLLVCFIGVPLTMISLGVKYLNECPIEPKIPVYLLVGGCVGLLKLLSLLWGQVRSRKYEKLDENLTSGDGDILDADSSRFMDAILSLFLTGWFIVGNYWVFHIWKPNFEQILHEPTNWCDKTVYMFAFCQIVGCYGLMGLILMLMCTLACLHRCCGQSDST